MSHRTMGCRVEQCDVKLTPEHATQISHIVEMGITEQQCLNKLPEINLSQYSAVYCPEEQLCGIDLHPEKTKALKFLAILLLRKRRDVLTQRSNYPCSVSFQQLVLL